MAISLSCDQCGKEYSVADTSAGKRFRCKGCDAIVTVPSGPGVYSSTEEDDDWEDDEWDDDQDDSPRSSSNEFDPYATPRRSKNRRSSHRNSIGSAGQISSVFMMIISGLWILGFLGFIMVLLTEVGGNAGGDELMVVLGVYGALFLVSIVLNGLIIYGAVQLRSGGSKAFAMTAAIICCIPCISPCGIFGIAIGIWALVDIQTISDAGGFNS